MAKIRIIILDASCVVVCGATVQQDAPIGPGLRGENSMLIGLRCSRMQNEHVCLKNRLRSFQALVSLAALYGLSTLPLGKNRLQILTLFSVVCYDPS